MESTNTQLPEITVSTSPRSSSFFDRVLRRTSSGSVPQSPPLQAPQPIPFLSIPVLNSSARSRSPSRSRSRSSRRGPATERSTKISHTHLSVNTKVASNSRSRSRSRSSRSSTRTPSPNIIMINAAGPTHRVASINHVGRHTNDWLFSGFNLGKIRSPNGRKK